VLRLKDLATMHITTCTRQLSATLKTPMQYKATLTPRTTEY